MTARKWGNALESASEGQTAEQTLKSLVEILERKGLLTSDEAQSARQPNKRRTIAILG